MVHRLVRLDLGALLVIASLDSRPDPPAVDPHVAAVKVPDPAECVKNVYSPAESVAYATFSLSFIRQTSVFLADIVPEYPTGIITETGQAADSSPPARIFGLCRLTS